MITDSNKMRKLVGVRDAAAILSRKNYQNGLSKWTFHTILHQNFLRSNAKGKWVDGMEGLHKDTYSIILGFSTLKRHFTTINQEW